MHNAAGAGVHVLAARQRLAVEGLAATTRSVHEDDVLDEQEGGVGRSAETATRTSGDNAHIGTTRRERL
jgi:hypothetical protein